MFVNLSILVVAVLANVVNAHELVRKLPVLPTIQQFNLFDAGKDSLIKTLVENAKVATCATELTIEAITAGNAARVVMKLYDGTSGQLLVKTTEKSQPWTLGQNDKTDYFGVPALQHVGKFKICATPFPASGPPAGVQLWCVDFELLPCTFTGTGAEVTAACAGNCCVGGSDPLFLACDWDGSRTVSAGSCNGNYACASIRGNSIGADSCNGSTACGGIGGNVASQSCNGDSACSYVNGDVGIQSCNAFHACTFNPGNVGSNSCNADYACVP